MEAEPRRSNRKAKPKIDPDFVYSNNCVRFLVPTSENTSDVWQRDRLDSEGARSLPSDTTIGVSRSVQSRLSSSSWSELHNLPLFNELNDGSAHAVVSDAFVNSLLSQSYSSNTCQIPAGRAVTSQVNKTLCVETKVGGGLRQLSSTRYDILEGEECFLSVSGSVRTDTSDMSSQENDCGCGKGESCAVCSASGGGNGDQVEMFSQILAQMSTMSKDFRLLKDEVASIRRDTKSNNSRIAVLESKSDVSEISEVELPKRGKLSVRNKQGSAGKSKEKKVRVEDEKQRSLKLLLENLIDKGKDKKCTESEVELSSDEEVNVRKVQKKMSRKQKGDVDKTVAAILRTVGGSFPEEEESASRSSESGTESEGSSRRRKSSSIRRKVKSGSKVKKRPVVRTELWPHTIANEDDGEDVTSENISLSKFLACFCYILTTCEGAEAAGRAALLYAVASVLECLPWSEARSFHNVVMVKIEQARIDWSTDFAAMAEQYLNKKVRLGMRSRGQTTSSASASKSSYGGGSSVGKGYGSYNRQRYTRNEFQPGRYRGSSSEVCRQWNGGTCSYGKNCRKEHCCLVCFNEGKTEFHKASFHWYPSDKGKTTSSNQRV